MNRWFVVFAVFIAQMLHSAAPIGAQRTRPDLSRGLTETSAAVLLPVPYIEQPDGSTCLPTSLNMVLHYMGRADLTTETIFSLHPRCDYDRYNLPAIVAEYGLHAFPSWLEHAWTPASIQAELRAGRPVILGADVSRAGHFVVAVGYTDDGRVVIHDPDWKANGFLAGGANIVTTWDRLIWRNGVKIRTGPFPEPPRKISATIVETTAPRTMISGDRAEALVSVRNNGSAPWPADTVLRPVDAYQPDWRAAPRTSPFGVASARPEHTTAPLSETPIIQPGEIALFRLPLLAPIVDRNQTFRENFNLWSPTDGWFDQHWQTGPSNREIFLRLAVVPPSVSGAQPPIPHPGTFETAGPIPGWSVKNPATDDTFTSAPFDLPPPPDGATAYSLFTADPAPHTAAYVGDPFGTNYSASAWIYCDYRPSPDPARAETTRVGLFIRDSGQHLFSRKTELESGDALTLSFDSDNGRLRAGTFARGGFDDWRPRAKAQFIRKSGWNHFRIDARGTSVTYFLNHSEILTADLASTAALAVRDYKLGPLWRSGDAGVFIQTVDRPNDAPHRRRAVHFADFQLRDLAL